MTILYQYEGYVPLDFMSFTQLADMNGLFLLVLSTFVTYTGRGQSQETRNGCYVKMI